MSEQLHDPEFTLYGYWRSSATWRIRIALNLKGLAFKVEPINLLSGQQLSEEYSKINPNNLLPALKLKSNVILVQSPAILEYLEEVYSERKLLPTDPIDRATVRGLMNAIVCDIHPIQNLRVLKKVQNITNQESSKVEWAAHFIKLGFTGLETMLSKTAGKYCFKDEVTFADICLVPQVYNALRFGISLDEFPIIKRVSEDLSRLKEFEDAHPQCQFNDEINQLGHRPFMFLKKWLQKDAMMVNLLEELDIQSSPSENIESSLDSGIEIQEKQRIDFLSLLPTELAIQIIKYINSIHMMKSLPVVCSRWRKLCQDNDIWRSLFIGRWGRPRNQAKIFTEKDWKVLCRSRLELNQNWNSGKVSGSCLSGHTDSVYCLQFDDSIIISGSRDKTIKFWSLKNKECIKTIAGHNGSVLCLQYSREYIITGSSDTTIIIWDFQSGRILKRLMGHSLPVLDIKFDDKYIASCSKDTSIKIWELHTGNLIRTLEGHKAAVNSIHLHKNLLTSASGDCSIRLWDITTGNLLREFLGHTRGLACVQHDDEYVASGSNDKTIRIWDINTGECLRVLQGHQDLVRTLYFDKERLVSGSYDQSIKAWSMTTGAVLWELPEAHNSWVFHVQMDPSKIITASQDRQIMIWDLSENVSNLADIL